jgi:hypothetical protein
MWETPDRWREPAPITVTVSTGLLVAVLGGVVILVAAFATWLVLFIQRRRRRVQARIAADLSSETALRGPASAIYQTGTRQYPRAGGNGRLVLTGTRLIFRIMIGTDVVIPLSEITGLREMATFQHRRLAGRKFLIVVTDAGEAAFAVHNIADWIAAIEQAARHVVSAR